MIDTGPLVTIPGLLRPLTPAERRVVALVGEGLGTVAIATRLHCGPRTVKDHITRAADKLAESGLVPGELHPKQRVRLFMLGVSARYTRTLNRVR